MNHGKFYKDKTRIISNDYDVGKLYEEMKKQSEK